MVDQATALSAFSSQLILVFCSPLLLYTIIILATMQTTFYRIKGNKKDSEPLFKIVRGLKFYRKPLQNNTASCIRMIEDNILTRYTILHLSHLYLMLCLVAQRAWKWNETPRS